MEVQKCHEQVIYNQCVLQIEGFSVPHHPWSNFPRKDDVEERHHVGWDRAGYKKPISDPWICKQERKLIIAQKDY